MPIPSVIRPTYEELYETQVQVRFHLYNALFSTLPFQSLDEVVSLLPAFTLEARQKLERERLSPSEVVETFLKQKQQGEKILFQFLQQVERQVALFDAIEDASFGVIHDLQGPGTLHHLLQRVMGGDGYYGYGGYKKGERDSDDSNGAVQDRLAELLKTNQVRVVLTAHPTQFYPDSILGILRDLTESIQADDIEKVRILLFQMGCTRFRNPIKPTPRQEAQSVLWYMENNFYPEVGNIHRRLLPLLLPSNLRTDSFQEQVGVPHFSPLVEVGFWPGGDRDGNPFVTADVTHSVARNLRYSILGLYIGDTKKLLSRLTFPGVYESLQEVLHQLKRTQAHPRSESKGDSRIFSDSRCLLRDLRKILDTLNEQHQGLFREALEDLIIKIEVFGFHFATMDLRQDSRVHETVMDSILKVTHLPGEINDSGSGDGEIGLQLGNGSSFRYASLSEEERLKTLEDFILKLKSKTWGSPPDGDCGTKGHLKSKSKRKDKSRGGADESEKEDRSKNSELWFDIESLEDPLVLETLRSYRVMRQVQRENGPKGLHRSIISNTKAASDVLEVLALYHLSFPHFSPSVVGYEDNGVELEYENKDERGDLCPQDPKEGYCLDIVPLFETIDDLKASGRVMETLYQNPLYRTHLQSRKMRQVIMLGFSDGTKDGGYLSANWSIYQAKRQLTELSRKMGVHLSFFDGRGGPPARGGGNTHRFYRSMGRDVEHSQVELTIQGQTISTNFGNPESCQFNLEQLLTASLESFLFHSDEGVLSPENVQILERLAEISHQKYLKFKNHPLFVPYLEEMTPLRFYEDLNLGSRPARRTSGGAEGGAKGGERTELKSGDKKSKSELRFEDLRAIPFVSAWAQIKQNISGFYGLGTALELLKTENPQMWEGARHLYRENLFFSTLVENAMQSLCKTYFPLTYTVKKDQRFGEFWEDIHQEAQKTTRELLLLTGMKTLMENEPTIKRSIEMREKIVFPLLTIQQYALEKLRDPHLSEEKKKELQELVIKSLAANINASRNSA